MKRRSLTSSSLASVGYDPDKRVLEIEFRDGQVYEYFDIPESLFTELLEAESSGRSFNVNIRDRFRFERLK